MDFSSRRRLTISSDFCIAASHGADAGSGGPAQGSRGTRRTIELCTGRTVAWRSILGTNGFQRRRANMAPDTLIEERVANLEKQLAELQRQVSSLTAKPSWFEQMAGSMREFPDFLEV